MPRRQADDRPPELDLWNYQHHLDKGELEEAKVWIDLGIETWHANRSLDANILRAERVYLYLRLKVKGFDFDEVFEDLHYSDNWWFSWNRAKIGMLVREGDIKEALYYASCGAHAIKGHEAETHLALEVDLFALCIEDCVAASAKETAVASNA